MHTCYFPFLRFFFFAIKKPPKLQSTHVRRRTIKEEISQYTNMARQPSPGNAVCWTRPYAKVKVTEKSYLTISCQKHLNTDMQNNSGMWRTQVTNICYIIRLPHEPPHLLVIKCFHVCKQFFPAVCNKKKSA